MPKRTTTLLTLIGACAALAGSPSGAAAAEPGCTLEGTGGTVTRSLGARSYELRVPAGLGGAEAPLLVSLHGFGASGRLHEASTGWSAHADARGFVVAYPNAGTAATGGHGAWDPYRAGSGDVPFLRSVVADIAARHCIDPARIHLDGHSNGAVMAQRAACAAPDLFASATSYGGGAPTVPGAEACTPARPIAVGLLVGQFDFTFAGLASNVELWRAVDGCASAPARGTDAFGTTDTYDCAAGTQVLARVVAGTSHEWPTGAKGADQRDRMWTFLQRHPLPAA